MFVKISPPKVEGGNTGSSLSVFEYLEKENHENPLEEQRLYFNHDSTMISKSEAINTIDNNNFKLTKEDEKFFMLTINPSEKEVQHLTDKYGKENLDKALQDYTKKVMDDYASNFNRYILKDTGEKYTLENPEHAVKIKANMELKESIKPIQKEVNIARKEHLKSFKADPLSPKTLELKEKLDKKLELLKSEESKYFLSADGKIIADNLKMKVIDHKLNGNDLVYFAKIETTRTYKVDDKAYQDIYAVNKDLRTQIVQLKEQADKEFKNENYIKSSEIEKQIRGLDKQLIRNANNQVIEPHLQKDGTNVHVHVIVSRKDKTQTLKLHPLTNSKSSFNKINGNYVQIGFNRDHFAKQAEKLFDKSYEHNRELRDSYEYRKDNKNDIEKSIKSLVHAPKDEKELARKLFYEATKDSEIKKAYNKIPKNTASLRNKAIDKAVDAIAVAVKANPTGLAVTAVKSIVKGVFGDISQSFEISR